MNIIAIGGSTPSLPPEQEFKEDLKRLIREIMEELGIEINPGKFLLSIEHEYASKIVELHIFECSSIKGTPNPMEGQALKWVKPEELSLYKFPPPDTKIIEFLCRMGED